MKDTKPAKTPMGTEGHLDLNAGYKSVDQKVYQSMIGSLLYHCASRPDIMRSVCICTIFQSDPKECHLVAVKHILRYLIHTPYIGLLYPNGSTFDLIEYSNSDYVGCKVDRKSTSETCQFFGKVLGVLEFKETNFHCHIHRRGQVCSRRPVLRATTLDEANPPGL
jgi:hypothetical protein